MKKLLLTLAVAMGAMTMSAAPVKVDFSTADYLPAAESAEATTATAEGVTFSFVNCKKGTYSGVSYLQISGKNNENAAWVDITPSFATENIVLTTGSNGSTNVKVSLFVGETAIVSDVVLSEKSADFTFAIPAAYQAAGTTYRLKTVNKYNAQLSAMTFNADGVDPVDPTPDTETTVAEAANIGAFLTAANTASETKITSAATAVYQNGRYLWVKDATGVLLCYNVGDIEMPKFVNGQTLNAGYTGKYVNYSNGQYQMTNLVAGTFVAGAEGAAVAPETIAIEELSADLVNTYVLIEGVNITAVTGKPNSFTVSDETGTVTLFNQFNNATYYDVVNVPEGNGLDLYAMVNVYQGNVQLYPVKVVNKTGIETVSTPAFSVAAGVVNAGTEVAISCATEGAAIHYTTDGTEPSAASTLYTAPIAVNADMTLKAIAVKDGMVASAIATAEYTVKVVDGTEYIFNFANPTSLTPAYSYDAATWTVDATTNAYENVQDVVFTSGVASLVTESINPEDPGTGARMYVQSAGTDNMTYSYRFYKKSQLVISVAEGYELTEIVFAPQTSSHKSDFKAANFTFSNGELGDNFTWKPASSGVTSLTLSSATKNMGMSSIVVVAKADAGVVSVEMNEDAPVEYYNLQGVRVAEPTTGLYIRRQGNKVQKVVL